MRKSALLLLLAGLVLQALAAKDVPPQSNVLNRITVWQLEQVLAAAHDKPDEEDAEQLSGLELRERFSTVRLLHWQVQLSGPKSRQALTALADESAFLDLPAAEIPTTAAPDLAAQQQMMALTVDYVTKTVHRLPDFSATRVTTSFRDEPGPYEELGAEWPPVYRPLPVTRQTPLHLVGTHTTTVLIAGPGKGGFHFSAFQIESTGIDDLGRVRAHPWHGDVGCLPEQTGLEPLGARSGRTRSSISLCSARGKVTLPSESRLVHRGIGS
jgi:hypothetical protein